MRRTIGAAEEAYDLGEDACVGDLMRAVVERHGAEVARHLYEGPRKLAPGAIVLVDGLRAADLASPIGAAAVEVVVLSPMMIGG